MNIKSNWLIIAIAAVVTLYIIAGPKTESPWRPLLPEAPHKVCIENNTYIRSVEYVGNGKYQVIMLPVSDSVKCTCK